jgi:tetratricopeptide (TPR) repeat protein
MTLKNNPEQAIAYYSAALEQLPDDIVIRRKIAHAYYLSRNWRDAYTNYAHVPISELREDEYKELFQSLFADAERPDRLTELAKYTIDTPTREYYQMIDACYSGIHNCIITIEWYTGSSTQILDLQRSIQKSTQISPDYQYRNFLVATELYRQGAYRAVDILVSEILSKRANYTEVRKLSWFALYELGRYSEARDILLTYLESSPQDIETISRLGEIYVYLGDYTTSSLYLNNAVTAGYPHKTQLERRLAYNYAAMGDHASMLKVLSYLLQESDVTEDDYAVAISLALKQWENIRAYAWSYTAIARYPNSVILTPLYISALRLNGRSREIPTYIHSLSDELAGHPLIQLEYAMSMIDDGHSDQALPILTAIRDQDPTTDWGIEAASQIRQITALQNQTGVVQ